MCPTAVVDRANALRQPIRKFIGYSHFILTLIRLSERLVDRYEWHCTSVTSADKILENIDTVLT